MTEPAGERPEQVLCNELHIKRADAFASALFCLYQAGLFLDRNCRSSFRRRTRVRREDENGNRIKNFNQNEENRRFSTLIILILDKERRGHATVADALAVFYSVMPKIIRLDYTL